MKAMKLPAMSKHPNGTASYYLRVATPKGSLWQCCTEEVKPIASVIASMEEQIAVMRKMLKASESENAGATPSDLGAPESAHRGFGLLTSSSSVVAEGSSR